MVLDPNVLLPCMCCQGGLTLRSVGPDPSGGSYFWGDLILGVGSYFQGEWGVLDLNRESSSRRNVLTPAPRSCSDASLQVLSLSMTHSGWTLGLLDLEVKMSIDRALLREVCVRESARCHRVRLQTA